MNLCQSSTDSIIKRAIEQIGTEQMVLTSDGVTNKKTGKELG